MCHIAVFYSYLLCHLYLAVSLMVCFFLFFYFGKEPWKIYKKKQNLLSSPNFYFTERIYVLHNNRPSTGRSLFVYYTNITTIFTHKTFQLEELSGCVHVFWLQYS